MQYYVAMADPECMSKITFDYQGRTVQGTVIDTCEGCKETGCIDVSPWIMKELLGSSGRNGKAVQDQGLLDGVQWYYTTSQDDENNEDSGDIKISSHNHRKHRNSKVPKDRN
ncbi:hypothetical protein HDU86_007582 [Geranomyces michiganensis]|nr:hypothetical protein HDU86_007582 [Geranomyces michiganensis]